MSDHTTWAEVMAPHVERFEVAAAFESEIVWNAEGAAAMAKLLKALIRAADRPVPPTPSNKQEG